MSVLKTKDNKEMIISCKCGCKDGVHFKKPVCKIKRSDFGFKWKE